MMLKLLAESRKRGKKTVTNAQPELDPLEKKNKPDVGFPDVAIFRNNKQQTHNK